MSTGYFQLMEKFINPSSLYISRAFDQCFEINRPLFRGSVDWQTSGRSSGRRCTGCLITPELATANETDGPVVSRFSIERSFRIWGAKGGGNERWKRRSSKGRTGRRQDYRIAPCLPTTSISKSPSISGRDLRRLPLWGSTTVILRSCVLYRSRE